MGHDPVKTEIRLDTASAPAGNGLLFDNSLNFEGLRLTDGWRRVMKRIAHGEPEMIKVVFQFRQAASCLNDRWFELSGLNGKQ